MRTIKATLAYDGTAYAGWQVQPDRATVQGRLEAALRKITGESIRVVASGRTDAGVHAAGQVVGFCTSSRLQPAVLMRALNAELPVDIAVLELYEVPAGFHAIRDAVKKRYRYLIHDGPVRDVFQLRYCWHYARGRLDAAAMTLAAEPLRGRHDFSSFQSAGAPRETTVRTVNALQLGRRSVPPSGAGQGRACLMATDGGAARRVAGAGQGDCGAGLGDWICLEIEADGFLYNMVRAIVGTLVEVGRGARQPDWPQEVLAACDRSAAGPTAPPQGLCLMNVQYDDRWLPRRCGNEQE